MQTDRFAGLGLGLLLALAALLACKGGGGGKDGSYGGPCTGTTNWDFDLPVPHDDCRLTISGSKVNLELRHSQSPQFPQFVCEGKLEDDKVDGTCSVLDGRGQAGVPHCLESLTYPTFTVRNQGDKTSFEVVVRGTRSESRCPPADEKLTGYRLTGDLPKKK